MDCFEVIPRRIYLFDKMMSLDVGGVEEIDLTLFGTPKVPPMKSARLDIDRMTDIYSIYDRDYRLRQIKGQTKALLRRKK